MQSNVSCRVHLKHVQYIELSFYTAEQVYTALPETLVEHFWINCHQLVWQAGGAIHEDEYISYFGAQISVCRQRLRVTTKPVFTTKK